MYISRSFKIRFILATIFILFLSTSAYAFASANTMISERCGRWVSSDQRLQNSQCTLHTGHR